MLLIEGLTVHYGEISAVRGVDLEVRQGETVALIGANGAGKSSILNTVAGLLRPSGGRIVLNGQSIGGLASHAVVSRGLVLVPEGRAMLGTMTVQDNLLLGASQRSGSREIRADMEKCYDLFPRLRERRGQFADSLSGGEQQMLAVARAIMAKPALMLLDEPSMGLSPLLAKEVFQIVRRIGAEGMTILLVEQNAKLALSVASRAYVLEQGKVASSGTRSELLDNAAVVAAYLGRSAEVAR
jgi:branched-chain amino acid transport system ATP-binding protein